MRRLPTVVVLLASSVLLSAFAVAQAPATNPNNQEAEKHVAAGNKLYDTGDLAKAKAEYEEAVRLAPEWADAHLELGRTLYELHEPERGQQELETAVKLDPQCWYCYIVMGNFADDQTRYEDALRLYEKAASIAPFEPKPYFYAGVAEIRLGQVEEGIAKLKKAEALGPADPSPFFVLGNVYFQLGKLYAASEQLTAAIKLEDNTERAKKAHALNDVKIEINPYVSDDERPLHLSYCLVRAAALLPNEHRKRVPDAETYVETADEEVYVWERVAQIALEMTQKKELPPTFADLVKIKQAGYMRAFILLANGERFAKEREQFETANPGKLAEFQQWAAANHVVVQNIVPLCSVKWMGQNW